MPFGLSISAVRCICNATGNQIMSHPLLECSSGCGWIGTTEGLIDRPVSVFFLSIFLSGQDCSISAIWEDGPEKTRLPVQLKCKLQAGLTSRKIF